MAKIQLVSAYINLSGSRDNVVFRSGPEALTYPETLILSALHGGAEHVHTLVQIGFVERDEAEEITRLRLTYGAAVDAVFPAQGGRTMIPLGDDGLPDQEEVDAAEAASTKAAAAVRAKRDKPVAKPKTPAPVEPEAPVPPVAPETPSFPDFASLPE